MFGNNVNNIYLYEYFIFNNKILSKPSCTLVIIYTYTNMPHICLYVKRYLGKFKSPPSVCESNLGTKWVFWCM